MANCNNNRCAHENDDQIALLAKVGRGPKGDAFKVEVFDDETSEADTRLKGYTYKQDSKEWIEVWQSENINGGRLHMYYHLNQNDIPKTFTMIFRYVRNDREHEKHGWSWTSPAIPYTHYDNIVMGSTVGTVFLKDHSKEADDVFKDMLTYPNHNNDEEPIDRDAFNAPFPPGGTNKITNKEDLRNGPRRDTNSTFLPDGSEWNVYLDIVEFDELIKITGLSEATLKDIIQETANVIGFELSATTYPELATVKANNLKSYIDKLVAKEYDIRKAAVTTLTNRINTLEQELATTKTQYDSLLKKIVEYFYGATWTARSGSTPPSITFASGTKAATGSINVNGYNGSTYRGAIKTHDDNSEGDVRAR